MRTPTTHDHDHDLSSLSLFIHNLRFISAYLHLSFFLAVTCIVIVVVQALGELGKFLPELWVKA